MRHHSRALRIVTALIILTVVRARADAAPSPAAGPASATAPLAAPLAPALPSASPYCAGEYADELAALSSKARDFEQQQPPYTYCIRTTAVYECPSYAPDGTLRRTRRRVVAHGTGFAYRQDAGETLLVTNDHVAEWPAVTDEQHAVEDIPPGCKRVSDSLKIVENERDAYERDDIPLTRAVADPQLDIAVLRAKAPLPIVPWRMGRSAALRERNAVDVRGFPLGVLRANNVGKVISAYDHDDDRDWDHDDFVVDALLSPGNSGSPVFAISCKTGEFELVGVYHAGYVKGSALNVVVGVDQMRDLLTTLKRSPHPRSDGPARLDEDDRELLLEAARTSIERFYPFGALTAAVRARSDGALVFEVMGKDFPLHTNPALVIEDLPAGDSFGTIGRIWAGNRQGVLLVDRSTLDAESQAQVSKLLDALRRDALLASSLHEESRRSMVSRERFREVTRLERAVRRAAVERQELAQIVIELSERLCPGTAEATGTIADALSVPAPRGTEFPPAVEDTPPPSWAPAISGVVVAPTTPIPLATGPAQ